MNRNEFGQLVAALRREHRDENDESWTQKKLGEETGLGELIIGKIERGQRTNLDEDTLLRLADALQLTSLERREFFFAALGVDGKQIARKEIEPDVALNKLIQIMEQLQLPAHLTDSYGDVVAANTIIIYLLDIPSHYVNTAYKFQAGYNYMRVIFDPNSGFRELLSSRWHNVAIHNMQLFRGITLRYRFTDYFANTILALRKYPLFKEYWQLAYLEDFYLNSEHYDYDHQKFGSLNYLATSTQILTSGSELYLVVYCPMSPQTSEVFEKISQQVGTTVRRFASWPNKETV